MRKHYLAWAAILTACTVVSPLLASDGPDDAAAVRRALSRQYEAHDKAFATRNEAALKRAMNRFYPAGFTIQDPKGGVGKRAKWLQERAAHASVGSGKYPANTGGFQIIDQRTVSASTRIDKLTLTGSTAATAEITERIATETRGRSAADAPREATSVVFTTTARDHWTKTSSQGWRLKQREIVAQNAISGIRPAEEPSR